MTLQSDAVGQSKWDLDTPALLVDLDIMDRNMERMARTIRQGGVGWRPHIKGQKVPAIALREIAAGAFGVTCAKLGEAEVMAAAGIRDILIANQIVGSRKIARLMNLLSQADVIVSVDCVENVLALDAAARERGLRLRVVIEVDIGMKRAGVDPGEPVLALARRIAECRGLHFAGLMSWEAHAIAIPDPEEKRRRVTAAIALLTDSARLCREAGLPVDIVSAGGTATYWITSRLPGVTEVQAGGGIFSDLYYRHRFGVDHEYAMTAMTTVISRPRPTRMIVDAGKKTMSNQAISPQPIGLGRIKSISLSAEHGTIELEEPSDTPRVGERLEFIVGFSDTTVFMHDEMYGIRDGRVEVVWPILARGTIR